MKEQRTNAIICAGIFRLLICLGWLGSLSGLRTSSVFAIESGETAPATLVTHVSQFQTVLSRNVSTRKPFRLVGTMTMVDTNRNLVVLQDASGAIALNVDGNDYPAHPGQTVSIEGTDYAPYFESFPDYPYRPTGWDIRPSFEAPSNWGTYHLTRMRGYIHPPITADYTFWIASDNSSELWLSSSEDPSQAKRIAFIGGGNWVGPYEWSRYPSQHSDPILLHAGQTYYIEAVQEQSLLAEHLSVAWQATDFKRSVIDGRFLTPWVENPEQVQFAATNGLLREYWTNYTLGSVSEIVGRRPFKSVLSSKGTRMQVLGEAAWPIPKTIDLGQPLPLGDNYRWSEVAGTVSFAGRDSDSANLEITDDNKNRVQIRVARMNEDLTGRLQNRRVDIRGVCEGMLTANGDLAPSIIWSPAQTQLSFLESPETNIQAAATSISNRSAVVSGDVDQSWSSFSSFRGVVTFNDQVLGKDYLYIQNDVAGIYVSQDEHSLKQLQLGHWVGIGGILKPGNFSSTLTPITVAVLGSRPMPPAVSRSVVIPTRSGRDGLWTEMSGVVHAVNTNGTLLLVSKEGHVSAWVGHTSVGDLDRYVNSALRLRGVLSSEWQDEPMLLVPSRSFVEVESEAPADPFDIPVVYTSDLANIPATSKWIQRVKIRGTVTFQNEHYLFVQDARGGVRAESLSAPKVKVGDNVEVVGFPGMGGDLQTLTESLVRMVNSSNLSTLQSLDLNKPYSADHRGVLVHIKATFLAQKMRGGDQVLDLQLGQRFYAAVLSAQAGRLPAYEPGSQLDITGVRSFGRVLASGEKATEEHNSLESVEILLRNPQDVVVLQGPPWWAWKGFLLLISILSVVIFIGLMVIYLLRRRLKLQQLAKLHFSRQILQSQEDERRRIAVNLHDTLGQNLLVIKNQSRLVKVPLMDEPTIRRRLDEISEVATQAIEEVRQITHNLRPYQLDRLGLTQAIRAVIKQVSENSSIQFASHVDEIDGLLDKESEIHVYRIVQESINNIIKHSRATEATVVVKKQSASVLLSIRDNGQGFDPVMAESAGLGLNSMAERAWILGGKSKINSTPGSTNLSFEIPMAES